MLSKKTLSMALASDGTISGKFCLNNCRFGCMLEGGSYTCSTWTLYIKAFLKIPINTLYLEIVTLIVWIKF